MNSGQADILDIPMYDFLRVKIFESLGSLSELRRNVRPSPRRRCEAIPGDEDHALARNPACS
jgi:hypothetical protein